MAVIPHFDSIGVGDMGQLGHGCLPHLINLGQIRALNLTEITGEYLFLFETLIYVQEQHDII